MSKENHKKLKISIICFLSLFLILVVITALYLYCLPSFVKSDFMKNNLSSIVKKSLNMDLSIEKPVLVTYFRPQVDFYVKDLTLKKDNLSLVELSDFSISISLKNVFKKKIKLNSISADKLIIRIDKLIENLPEQKTEQEPKPLDWSIDLYNSQVDLISMVLSYKMNKTNILIDINNINISQKEGYKTLNFLSKIKVSKFDKTYLDIVFNSFQDVKLFPDRTEFENLKIHVNNSRLITTTTLDSKKLTVKAKSDRFFLEDIFKIIQSDIIIPDGETLLAPLVNPNGKISYDIKMVTSIVPPYTNELSGSIFINNTKASIKDLAKLPLNVETGKLLIDKNEIKFVDLLGYYGKNKTNGFKIYGSISDYYKSLDSNITIDTKITNEFFKDYLSKLINNTVLYASKPIGTRIIYNSKNNIMDITWLSKINKGVNFGVSDEKSALSDYDRAIKGDFHIAGDKLNIKNINYYIAPDIHKGMQIKPILTLNGDMDLMGNIEKMGFFFAREMPSELLNVFTKDSTFKKGTIKGKMYVEFKGKTPILDADMELQNTFIPSQRMRIKEAKLTTDDNYITAKVSGRFKRSNFEFLGKLKNELTPPYNIKNLSLSLDDIDVERFLSSINNQNEQTLTPVANDNADDVLDDFMFDTNLLRIEQGKFSVKKGKYKELEFGNIDSDITLDDKGILKIQSNKFDIAEGISTLKVICDLSQIKYYVRLGMKDVNSDIMAKVLLNLDKEISGKASGLVEINSDKSMQLNGQIKFLVKNGTIGKIGLVEYILKIASVFRNPVVMISPGAIVDIVNIPEGKFDKINGEMKIKNNVVHNINIQSSSDQLSALIRGRFDMNKHDASLRIYTRFSSLRNSPFSFLRNVSLNALANKVQMNSRNDINYYSSELKDLPQIKVDENKAQIFLTQVEGDVEHNNFISMLKKIK